MVRSGALIRGCREELVNFPHEVIHDIHFQACHMLVIDADDGGSVGHPQRAQAVFVGLQDAEAYGIHLVAYGATFSKAYADTDGQGSDGARPSVHGAIPVDGADATATVHQAYAQAVGEVIHAHGASLSGVDDAVLDAKVT